MNERLQLRLLGVPDIEVAGDSVAESLSSKAQAILYYLAVTGQPQARPALATLLWGDMPEAAAWANLRRTLVDLRRSLENFLDIDRHTVAFKGDCPIWVDVAEFEAGVNRLSPDLSPPAASIKRLQAAIELYRGDFLASFYVLHAPDFETWMLAEQARLRELVVQALHTLAIHHTGQGELVEGAAYTRRLLHLEPWREEAHRQLMLLLARAGQRSAALAQYETCRQMLAEELGVEPDQQTTALYERIRDGEFSSEAARQGRSGETYSPAPPLAPQRGEFWPRSPALLPNLPPQATPFIGRKRELADIIRRLTDRDCRLLTLVGPGGIGKTRLALQVAQAFIDSRLGQDFFAHGVLFVPLAAVDSTNGLVSALAKGPLGGGHCR